MTACGFSDEHKLSPAHDGVWRQQTAEVQCSEHDGVMLVDQAPLHVDSCQS